MGGAKSWVTGWHWRERIANFEPSWFTIVMSTGTLQLCFVNFPYPITGGAHWLRDIGFCLWILEIVLFGFFIGMIIYRYVTLPGAAKKNLLEFPASSFLGAIPISLNTIIQGIISYYDYRTSARWACFALYWVALVLSLSVSFGLVIVQMSRSAKQDLSNVAGVWVMVTVPLFTTAATAGSILSYVNMESTKCAIAVLVTGFMAWAFALAEVSMIMTIYFFRLIAYKSPPQPLMVGSFLPCAALSQGAFAILRLSIFLASYIKSGYAPTQVNPPATVSNATLLATSEVIHWMGIIMNLYMLAIATFWLIQGASSILFSLPQLSFNIAYWSSVFPVASYANTWCFISRDLRDDGMRGWAATMVMIATLLWLLCAGQTVYRGFWKGSLFSAPGLEDWTGDQEEQDEKGRGGRKDDWSGEYTKPSPGSGGDEENGQSNGHANGGESNGNDVRRRS